MIDPRRRSRPARGFTLLEVLVAFVLFALLYTVLLNVMSGALRNADVSSDYDRAVMSARSVLAELGTGIPIESGVHRGEAGDDGLRWQLRIESADEPAAGARGTTGELRLYDVELTMSWPAGRGERTFRIVTQRLAAADAGR